MHYLKGTPPHIPLHHLPFAVDGKALPAGFEGDATKETAGLLPGHLGTSQCLF